jgi:hypothetical protein
MIKQQQQLAWTALDQSNTVSRVRVFFSLYRSFNEGNICRWHQIYSQNRHNFTQSGYPEVCGDKCEDESCFQWYLTKKQCRNCKRVRTGPDQARPVPDCQSWARSSPTFRWDRTGGIIGRDELDLNNSIPNHICSVVIPRGNVSDCHT